MAQNQLSEDSVQETRIRMAGHLVELHRLHLVLANDARSMKSFSFDGRALAEIEMASDAGILPSPKGVAQTMVFGTNADLLKTGSMPGVEMP